jgi:hypothetical protein
VRSYQCLELTCYLHLQSRRALLGRWRKLTKIEIVWDVTPYILVDVNLSVEPAASVVMVEESNCGYNGCSLNSKPTGTGWPIFYWTELIATAQAGRSYPEDKSDSFLPKS